MVIYGTIASGTIAAASAPYWAPALTAACSGGYAEAMIFAASPMGQQIIKGVLDCVDSVQDYSVPAGTKTGGLCAVGKIIYDKLK